MKETKELLKQLRELVDQEKWSEAGKLAKQISTLAETNLKNEKNQLIFNYTNSFANSYPQMKYYSDEKGKWQSIYDHFKAVHSHNLFSLEERLFKPANTEE